MDCGAAKSVQRTQLCVIVATGNNRIPLFSTVTVSKMTSSAENPGSYMYTLFLLLVLFSPK